MTVDGKPDQQVVKSVGRVFEILESFARVQTPLTANEVGSRLDYPASSTAAILKSMVALGYLAFDRATRTYFPTIRLGFVCSWIDQATFGDVKLERLVEELRTATGETIIIAVQNDLAVQYLLNRPGIFPVRFLAPAGLLRPLCSSGTGWALLSGKPETEVIAIVRRLNRTARPAQKIDSVQLLDLLAEVRRQGYATSYGNVIAGSGVIAMVLPGLSKERTLVLGVGGPVERLEKKEAAIVAEMCAAILRHFPAL